MSKLTANAKTTKTHRNEVGFVHFGEGKGGRIWHNQSLISNLSLNIFCSVRERPIEVANFDQEDMDSFTWLMMEPATLEEII